MIIMRLIFTTWERQWKAGLFWKTKYCILILDYLVCAWSQQCAGTLFSLYSLIFCCLKRHAFRFYSLLGYPDNVSIPKNPINILGQSPVKRENNHVHCVLYVTTTYMYM